MEDQAANSSYLLQMPLLVIEEILSNVLNLSSVSRTCKTLYEIVYDMEKRKRVVISIKRMATTDNSVRLTIDDDAVFASIMNSLRRITEIQLDLFRSSSMELNERQLERITAIMKRFGTSVTSLILCGIVLSINEIIELLSLTPKLETLKFAFGKASGNATKLVHLPNLKTLEIKHYSGLLGVANLIPAGSLNYFSYHVLREKPEILKTVLTKQHNIKSLTICNYAHPIGAIDLCVNLQLEKLDLQIGYTDDQLVEMLKCHTNLKELRWAFKISVSACEWICKNLKQLEVFKVKVDRRDTQGKNLFVMLRELKNLRYLSTKVIHLLDDKYQFKINSLEKLEIENEWPSSEDFNKMVHSMARTFTNLTDLEIDFNDFSQLSMVLSRCTKLIRLTSRIEQPDPQQFAGKRFPNIRQLSISASNCDVNIIISIVRAMPNLKSLSMDGCTIFNVDKVKKLICEKNSLEDLHVNYFYLDDNLSTSEDFVNTVRCLSDNLKTYRLTFRSSTGNSCEIRDILSNEFNVRDKPSNSNSSYFNLHKGDLTPLHDEFIN